jgi:hypothetical protein
MDIGDVSRVESQGGAVQFQAIAQANQLAISQQMASQGIATADSSVGHSDIAKSSTNVNYSPAIYAQAAQYQLYTQSGALLSILGAQNMPVSADATAGHDDGNEIHAVEATIGNHIDAKA